VKNFSIILISVLLFSANSYSQGLSNKYIRLPDGSSIQIQNNQSADEAWWQAMRNHPKSFGIYVIPDAKKIDLDWFNECRASAAKNAKTDSAVVQLVTACRHQAVPKKCRSLEITKDSLGNEVGEARVNCVEQCMASNYYSKTIGECSKG
jgi:hypothetical protein